MGKDITLMIQNPSKINERKIIWNKDEVKIWVSQITEKYNGLIFDKTQIKEAKEERAKLNKLKKAISDKRIDVKNDFMAPYLNFEKEVKEVVELIDVPIKSIDCQVKKYEEQQKKEKKEKIAKFFDENVKDLLEYVHFNDVFEDKYLNASMPYKKIEKEILSKLDKVYKDIDLIKGAVDLEYRKIALEIYKEKKDLSTTVGEINRLKRIEIEKKKQEENKRVPEKDFTPTNEVKKDVIENNKNEEVKINVEEKEDSDKVIDPFTRKEPEKIYRARFTCYGSKSQLIKLKKFMIDNGIKFE